MLLYDFSKSGVMYLMCQFALAVLGPRLSETWLRTNNFKFSVTYRIEALLPDIA